MADPNQSSQTNLRLCQMLFLLRLAPVAKARRHVFVFLMCMGL